MSGSTDSQLRAKASANVLVVDDEPFVRDLVTRCLNAEGYACAGAANGQAALEHLQSNHVDLVILDIRMPGCALPEEDALAILERGQGSHFDPALVPLFFSVLPEINRIAEENPDESAETEIRGKPLTLERSDRIPSPTAQPV